MVASTPGTEDLVEMGRSNSRPSARIWRSPSGSTAIVIFNPLRPFELARSGHWNTRKRTRAELAHATVVAFEWRPKLREPGGADCAWRSFCLPVNVRRFSPTAGQGRPACRQAAPRGDRRCTGTAKSRRDLRLRLLHPTHRPQTQKRANESRVPRFRKRAQLMRAGLRKCGVLWRATRKIRSRQ